MIAARSSFRGGAQEDRALSQVLPALQGRSSAKEASVGEARRHLPVSALQKVVRQRTGVPRSPHHSGNSTGLRAVP